MREDFTASTSPLVSMMWIVQCCSNLSRGLPAFQAPCNSRSPCYHIIFSSGITQTHLLSCETSSVMTPEAWGRWARCHPTPLAPLVLSGLEGRSSDPIMILDRSVLDQAEAQNWVPQSKEDTSESLWVRTWLGLMHPAWQFVAARIFSLVLLLPVTSMIKSCDKGRREHDR